MASGRAGPSKRCSAATTSASSPGPSRRISVIAGPPRRPRGCGRAGRGCGVRSVRTSTTRTPDGAPSAFASSSGVPSQDVRRAGRGAQRREVDAVRRAEDPLEDRRVLRRALLELGEQPAAVVVHHDDREVGPRLVRADHQAGAVVQEGQVAHQRVRRSAACARAAPIAVDTVPSMPEAPRLASTSGGSASHGSARSRSRTALDDPATSSPPAGTAARDQPGHREAVEPARSSRTCATASSASASASSQLVQPGCGRWSPVTVGVRGSSRSRTHLDVGRGPAAG